MIVTRDQKWITKEKIFRRDPMPDQKFTRDPEIVEKYNTPLVIKIQTTNKYNTQLSKSFYRKEIKKLRSDIQQGYLYEDGPAGGDTHFLSDFSHKDSHVLSKKINEEDRLNYRVYRPTLTKNQNGTYDYSMKVVLESCSGHELNGTPDYVEDQGYKNLKRNKNSRN